MTSDMHIKKKSLDDRTRVVKPKNEFFFLVFNLLFIFYFYFLFLFFVLNHQRCYEHLFYIYPFLVFTLTERILTSSLEPISL